VALYAVEDAIEPAAATLAEAWAAWSGGGPLTLGPDRLDPEGAALAGLWAVLAAEHPERAPRAPRARWSPIPDALEGLAYTVRAGDGPLSAFASRELSAPPDDAGYLVLPVDPPPDAPLRAIQPAEVRAWVRSAVEGLERRAGPRPLVLTTAEHLTGRPLGGPAAAVAGAATAWARSRGAPVVHVGPWGEGPRRLGVAPIDGAALRGAVRAAPRHGRLVVVDARWPEVGAAFPHLRALADALGAVSMRDRVRDEVARALRSPDPPMDRPLRDLGMDSLGLEALRVRLEALAGRPIPADFLFRHATIAAIADAL
jgi:acyl carrier protein